MFRNTNRASPRRYQPPDLNPNPKTLTRTLTMGILFICQCGPLSPRPSHSLQYSSERVINFCTHATLFQPSFPFSLMKSCDIVAMVGDLWSSSFFFPFGSSRRMSSISSSPNVRLRHRVFCEASQARGSRRF